MMVHFLLKTTASFFIQAWSEIWSWIAALLSPATCVHCHCFLDERIPLCCACNDALVPLISVEIHITSMYTMKIFAVSEYTGIIRSLIMAKQLGSRLPSKQLGQLVAQHCLADWDLYDYIVPVPLHWRRYAERGFNQSEEMAKIIGITYQIEVMPGVIRKRATVYQTTLEQKARRKNVTDAFEISEHVRELYKGKHLLLVDDVITTGSTLSEIARVLATCRPASITAVVAARVVLK